MGSKKKAGSGHARKQPAPSPTSSLHGAVHEDYAQTLQQAESSVFYVSYKEILLLLVLVVSLAAFSIGLGVTAGWSISIHYQQEEEESLVQQSPLRVTRLDPSIVYASYLQPQIMIKEDEEDEITMSPALPLRRVVTMSESGQRNVLQVVQESAPIGQRANTSLPLPPKMDWSEMVRQAVPPVLCSDGVTVGYDSWSSLRAAVEQVNLLSALRYLRWTEYFALTTDDTTEGRRPYFDDDSLYYEDDVILTICPGVTLRAWRGPIFVNAENLRIECEDHCVVDVGGSHFRFGPHARNVLLRGITFLHAKRASLLFYSNNAEATFEDCSWKENGPDNRKFGAVADVNSTAFLNFYRCQIGNERSAFLPHLMRSYLPFW